MDSTFAIRIVLPVLFLAFVLLVMVWPVLRLSRQAGVFAVTLHRESTPERLLISVAVGLILLATLAFIAVAAVRGPDALGLWQLPAFLRWLGLALVAAGIPVISVAQRQMGVSFRIGIDDAPTPLVKRGLFAVVRNPIFTAMLAAFAGLFLAVPCVWTLLIWIAATLAIGRQVRLEERHLRALHGDAYRRYLARVGRFVPGVGRIARGSRDAACPPAPRSGT